MNDDCDSKLHFDTRQFFHLKWERPEDLRATLAEHIKSTIGLGLADYRPIPRLPETVRDDRLAEWRRLLRLSPTQGRAVIQRAIRGRITFTPIPGTGLRPDPSGSTEIGGYEFEAETRFDGCFSVWWFRNPNPALLVLGSRSSTRTTERAPKTSCQAMRTTTVCWSEPTGGQPGLRLMVGVPSGYSRVGYGVGLATVPAREPGGVGRGYHQVSPEKGNLVPEQRRPTEADIATFKF
jgi:hypothetical protein